MVVFIALIKLQRWFFTLRAFIDYRRARGYFLLSFWMASFHTTMSKVVLFLDLALSIRRYFLFSKKILAKVRVRKSIVGLVLLNYDVFNSLRDLFATFRHHVMRNKVLFLSMLLLASNIRAFALGQIPLKEV